jgi:hypothetical protein
MGCRVDSPRINMKVVGANISVLSPNDALTSYSSIQMEMLGIRERTGVFSLKGVVYAK